MAPFYSPAARALQDRFASRRLADGDPGFVRVVDERTLAFPCYDGNGMFLSFGNVRETGKVGMLFADFEAGRRLRVNGTAAIAEDDPLLPEFAGAVFVVRVAVAEIFPNCPRYLPRYVLAEPSPYVPGRGKEPPVPDWKLRPEFAEVLPGRG